MSKTPNLQLILPASNSTGWGESINNNFTKIDNIYADLENKINRLDMRTGSMGMYYQDPQYDGALYPTSETQFNLKVASTNALVSLDTVLSQLLDGSYFIVDLDNTQITSVTYNSIRFIDGDIAVKLSSNVNGIRTHTLTKLPQTVGGFYKLSEITGTNYPQAVYTPVDAVKKSEVNNLKSSPILVVKPMSVQSNQINFEYVSIDNATGNETRHGQACTLDFPQVTTQAFTWEIDHVTKVREISAEDFIITEVTFEINGKPAFLSYEISTVTSTDDNGNTVTWHAINIEDGASRLKQGDKGHMYAHYIVKE